jgi:signal transduction histidine kinase
VQRPEPAAVAAICERVLVLAPWGRDAAVISGILSENQIVTTPAREIGEFNALLRGGSGAALVTEEALTPVGLLELMTTLEEQAAWSDVPVLLLTGSDNGTSRRNLALLTSAHNITVLQRPIPAITLVTAVQSALRSRHRQYEVRDLIAREQAARQEAEAATRLKDQFLASVSHELRTPLTAISIWVHLLIAGQVKDEQKQQALLSIASGAEAQSRLIEDLLDVSRMIRGELRLELQARALAPIVLAAMDVVRPMAEAKGVRLEAQLGGGAEVVLVDPERTRQIFWNLLSNAIKFTARGGQVSLTLSGELEHVSIDVTDSGEGIDSEFLPHVFDRFRQADPLSTRRHAGLGLGLSIVQQLVQLHGGEIVASSAGKGKGSTFTLRLPRVSSGEA